MGRVSNIPAPTLGKQNNNVSSQKLETINVHIERDRTLCPIPVNIFGLNLS